MGCDHNHTHRSKAKNGVKSKLRNCKHLGFLVKSLAPPPPMKCDLTQCWDTKLSTKKKIQQIVCWVECDWCGNCGNKKRSKMQ
jgi:hypothetical protein